MIEFLRAWAAFIVIIACLLVLIPLDNNVELIIAIGGGILSAIVYKLTDK